MSFDDHVIRENHRLQAALNELRGKLTEVSFQLNDAREAASLDREELRIALDAETRIRPELDAARATIKMHHEMIRAVRDACITTPDGSQVIDLKRRILAITSSR